MSTITTEVVAGALEIAAGNNTLVMWSPVADAAVFHLNGHALTVPRSALDAVALVAADTTEPAQEQSSATTGEGA